MVDHEMLERFYDSEEQFDSITQQLRLTPCPHCHLVGALIRHGALAGLDENRRTILRGRRIFCNNRKVRKSGCGRTFSILLVNMIRRSTLGAVGLWKFLEQVAATGNKFQALRSACRRPSDSAPYRIWKRFRKARSRIRTALLQYCQPPDTPNTKEPAKQTIAHLRAAFREEPCPITAFQRKTQTNFF